jgi:phenylalanine-4-hydroxylase
MKEDVKEYTTKMNRPLTVNYNALTQSIEVLDSRDKLTRYAASIKGDLTRLISAIEKTVPQK